jgi:short-subunit dehydrogenase
MTKHTQKTMAIFGAGTGLGSSVATRFGREGYRVALVARRAAPLQELVADLAKAGVEAQAFPFDLTEITGIPAFVRSIEDKLGPIDVAVYAPVTPDVGFVPALDLDSAKLRRFAELLLFAPIELAHAIVPGMVARGGGAFVLGGGLTAVHPMPGMSGAGPVMAAARNFIFTLNAEAKDKGVYAGTVTIGALIERSAGHRIIAASGQPIAFPVISPDTIADEIWSLVNNRDCVEAILPPLPTK